MSSRITADLLQGELGGAEVVTLSFGRLGVSEAGLRPKNKSKQRKGTVSGDGVSRCHP